MHKSGYHSKNISWDTPLNFQNYAKDSEICESRSEPDFKPKR